MFSRTHFLIVLVVIIGFIDDFSTFNELQSFANATKLYRSERSYLSLKDSNTNSTSSETNPSPPEGEKNVLDKAKDKAGELADKAKSAIPTNPDGSLSATAIVAIVVVSLAGLVIIGVLISWFKNRK